MINLIDFSTDIFSFSFFIFLKNLYFNLQKLFQSQLICLKLWIFILNINNFNIQLYISY
jgi:hypothetical protein